MKYAVIAAVVVVIAIVVFVLLKGKKKNTHWTYDKHFKGKHSCDFKTTYYTGFIAESNLVLKERAGNDSIGVNLTIVKEIVIRTFQSGGEAKASIAFNDENGNPVGDSYKLKTVDPKTARTIADHVRNSCNWVKIIDR